MMRLLNTGTGRFEEFIGRNIPKYAILSHTWEDEEVSYKDMTSDQSYQNMEGYRKIKKTCGIALQAGYSYAWVDTCCIDKSSSAELTEAINSMYKWYQRAEMCYVFLSDLDSSASLEDTLQHCKWFTRGWTLQELIAPRTVTFFDQQWNYRASKKDMIGKLSMITKIDGTILDGSQPLSTASIAQRMSWASCRETTRIEDEAYCLLGIFDINMPLLYGEERKAFRRLQEEIIKSTSDLSIFAWHDPRSKTTRNPNPRVYCGVLADSPLNFAESGPFSNLPRRDSWDFSLSNSGVKIQCQIVSEPIPGKRAYFYLASQSASSLGHTGPSQYPKDIGSLV
ncbi:heterokaryon incompatibility protein-domain-containing protein [Stachybotrys elegans]|uniref:Heterokaryon incompatibility protein-domain-containing protein n=1 Tax=Stachybotrys elegans TaxID=80388 RepID=A0A8K0SDT2_9HYPO|nr:heterokaryon incompatibility protein-domain-containing protein [Stachybotrys elegans]